MIRGPRNPDYFRVSVRGVRWYTDPLPADGTWGPLAQAVPAVTTVKKAWSRPFRKKTAYGTVVPLDAYRAAEYVTGHLSELQGLDGDEVFRRVAESPEAALSQAADRGTSVHELLEALADGTPLLLDLLPPEVAAFAPACRRFVEEWQPEWQLAEVVAINQTIGWGGTADCVAVLPDLGLTVIDWKSRGGEHGCYPEEACQLGGYAAADYYIVEDDSTGDIRYRRIPVPNLDSGAVVSLKADGTYAVYPVDISDAKHAFLAMFETWRVKRDGEKLARSAIGRPLTCPREHAPEVAIPTGPPAEQEQGGTVDGHGSVDGVAEHINVGDSKDAGHGISSNSDLLPVELHSFSDRRDVPEDHGAHNAEEHGDTYHTETEKAKPGSGSDDNMPDQLPPTSEQGADRIEDDGDGETEAGGMFDAVDTKDRPPPGHDESARSAQQDSGNGSVEHVSSELREHLRVRVTDIVGHLGIRPLPVPWPSEVPTLKSGAVHDTEDLHIIGDWCMAVEDCCGLSLYGDTRDRFDDSGRFLAPVAPPLRPPPVVTAAPEPDEAVTWAERGKALLSLLDDHKLSKAVAAVAKCEAHRMNRVRYLSLQAVLTQVQSPNGVLIAHWVPPDVVEIRAAPDIETVLLACMPMHDVASSTITAGTKGVALRRARHVAARLGLRAPKSYQDLCGDLLLAACVAVGHGVTSEDDSTPTTQDGNG